MMVFEEQSWIIEFFTMLILKEAKRFIVLALCYYENFIINLILC
jgi:hypothetical protein